jgi:adenylosuccinate lyase
MHIVNSGLTIADIQGRARRFTDHSIEDPGIRELYAIDSLWQRYLDVEAAMAAAQADLGMIPRSAAQRIAECANVEFLDGARITMSTAQQAHPLTPLLDEFVRVAGPEAGGWIHWGATTHNIVISGRALVLREAHEKLRSLVGPILERLADLADAHAETLMAGRTHGQHAVPITFGFKVAEWVDPLVRIDRRLSRSLAECELTMLGGAVGTFAGFGPDGPAVQNGVAARLGTVPMDVPSRAIADSFHGYLGDLSLLSAHVARIALEIETLMQTEFSELAEPRSSADVGSSTMPHKRNPKLCADILDLDGEVRARVTHALNASVHPHEADGRAEQILTLALEDAQTNMGDMLARLLKVVTGLEIHPARMARNLRLTQGLLGSEAVMLALGKHIGRDRAHRIVKLAGDSVTAQVDFSQVLASLPEVAALITAEQLRDLLDPVSHVAAAPRIARETAARVRLHLGEYPPRARAGSGSPSTPLA